MNSLSDRIRGEAFRIVMLQLAGVMFFAFLAWIFFGMLTGFSLLSGGLAYVLPNFFFVWRVFRYAGAQQMTQFLAAFFLGEMLKIIISAILFLLIVKYLAVSLLSTLIGFIGAIVAFWFACMWLFTKQAQTKQVYKA